MPRTLPCLLVVFALTAAGCDSEVPGTAEPAQPAPPPPGAEPSSAFDPASCGSVTGYVTWTGAIPDVPPVQYAKPRSDGMGYDFRTLTLPNAPRIDRFSRALAGAVVYLRDVNPAQARPWDLPPVSVEFRDYQLQVTQGPRTGRTGFVRRGASVAMQSAEPVFHILRGRGAAYFSLPFPDAEKPLSRTFDTTGPVELTSGAGFYWQTADLFVCEHPYFAVTDAQGHFRFTQVPAGRYELVAWHPNHDITRTERNPESGMPFRLIFAPPFETTRPVVVEPGRSTLANLTLPK